MAGMLGNRCKAEMVDQKSLEEFEAPLGKP